jgi:hypothetical protein
MPASDDPFASKPPQSRKTNPRRFPAWIFGTALFGLWMSTLTLAWRGPKDLPIGQGLLGLMMGLMIVLQVWLWTRQVQKDVEGLESQIRGLSATVVLQAAQLDELRKEREHVAS